MREAITEAGQEKVYVYSVDGSPASKKALVEHTGGMMGIGAQSPINLGKKAVKIANAVLNGEDYEKETYEETFFINRDNVEMYGTDGWQDVYKRQMPVIFLLFTAVESRVYHRDRQRQDLYSE